MREVLNSNPLFLRLAWLVWGTRVRCSGRSHRLCFTDARLRRCRVEMSGDSCELVLGRGSRLWDCRLTLAGNACRIVIGDRTTLRGVRLVAEDSHSTILVGNDCDLIEPTLLSQEGRKLTLGTGCMVSARAELRTSDSHSILDAATGGRINPAKDIVLEDRVWVGTGALIFAGSQIGEGSVIGAHSLVKHAVPPGCIAAGVPAAVKRAGIRWDGRRL